MYVYVFKRLFVQLPNINTVCICVYIYIYRERERHLREAVECLARPPTFYMIQTSLEKKYIYIYIDR